MRDDTFEFAEVGAMDNGQDWRGVHVTQGNFEREIAMEDGEALSRQGRSKRELTLPFSIKLCDHVFGYATPAAGAMPDEEYPICGLL